MGLWLLAIGLTPLLGLLAVVTLRWAVQCARLTDRAGFPNSWIVAVAAGLFAVLGVTLSVAWIAIDARFAPAFLLGTIAVCSFYYAAQLRTAADTAEAPERLSAWVAERRSEMSKWNAEIRRPETPWHRRIVVRLRWLLSRLAWEPWFGR
jgi:hypothetical protein